ASCNRCGTVITVPAAAPQYAPQPGYGSAPAWQAPAAPAPGASGHFPMQPSVPLAPMPGMPAGASPYGVNQPPSPYGLGLPPGKPAESAGAPWPLLIGGGVAALVLVVGAISYFAFSGRTSSIPAVASVPSQPVTQSAPVAPSTTAAAPNPPPTTTTT